MIGTLRVKVAVAVLIGAVLAGGCTRTVLVHTGTDRDSKISGIPFYAKRTVLKQTTVYRRSYMRVSLQITQLMPGADANAAPREVPMPPLISNVPNDAAGRKALSDLRAALNNPRLDVDEAVKGFSALPQIDDPANVAWATEPIANSLSLVSEVDFSQVYYLNSRAPWFGSGSLNAQLATDGTLTSAEASVEPSIAEGLPSIVPFREYLESRYVTVAAGDAALALLPVEPPPPRQPVTFKFGLSVDELGELATFEKIVTPTGNADPRTQPSLPPIERNFSAGQFTIRPLQAAPGGQAANANAWTVSGSLTPPKPQQGQ